SRTHGFLDDDTLTYKHLPHGAYEIRTRDGRVILHDDPGETIQVDPSGSVTRIPNTSSRMADLQNAQQAALATLSQGPAGAAPGGSSTAFDAPLGLQPINFTRAGTDAAPGQVAVSITPNSSGFIEVAQLKPPPPVLSADAGPRAIIEIPHTTGNTLFDTTPSASLSFTDLKLSSVSASLASITWSGGGTLPSGLSTVLASDLATTASSDSTVCAA